MGCSAIWNADDYRGSSDASVDATVDVGADADQDASTNDAELDTGSDVRDANIQPDCYEASAPLRITESGTYRNLRIVVDDETPAIEIRAPDVELQDIEIVLRGGGPGIVIADRGSILTGIRVIHDGGDTEHAGIESAADAVTEVTQLTVNDVEIDGMLGIILSGISNSDFAGIRVFGPTTTIAEEDKRVAIACDNCVSVGFAEVGVYGGTNLVHLMRVAGDDLFVRDLDFDSDTADFPFLGIAASPDVVSNIRSSQITGARSGIQLRGPGSWNATDIHVERRSCDPDDFAYDAHNESGGGRSCTNCTVDDAATCAHPASSPMAPVGWAVTRARRTFSMLPALDFCVSF